MIPFLDLFQKRLHIFNREWLRDVNAPACCALFYHVNDLLVCRRLGVIVLLFFSSFADYKIELGMDTMIDSYAKNEKEYGKDCTESFLGCTVAFLPSRNACNGLSVLADSCGTRERVHYAASCAVNILLYPTFSIDSLATRSRVTLTYVAVLHFDHSNCQQFRSPTLDHSPRLG